jgi:uncharacterized lipoprotein YddW (UPF0748 family)
MPGPTGAELRGAWFSDPRGVNWRQAMSDLRKAGFNTVFVNFSSAGAAFYPSHILPNVATRDEMRLCIDAAHAEGIQVHAKFIVWYMFQAPTAQQSKMARERRLLLLPNGQILFQGDSTWLNPALKKNRDERLAAILEAVQNYPVEGVQLDYVRYPDNAGPMTMGRRDAITRFVADVHSEVKRARPGTMISVSHFYDYNRARKEMGQDWVLWAQRGYVDFLCPMDYTRDLSALDNWVQTQERLIGGHVPIYPGLAAYMLPSSTSLNEQISIVRHHNHRGFLVFKYDEHLRQNILPGLRF